MPQIGTADVTYTHVVGSTQGSPSVPMHERVVNISFGNGTLFYTNGGIPLSIQKLGTPQSLQRFIMMDEGSSVGYVAKFDKTAISLRLYVSTNTTAAGTTALVELNTAAAVSATLIQAQIAGW